MFTSALLSNLRVAKSNVVPYNLKKTKNRTKKFGFKIKPEEMASVKTLNDFCDYIQSKVG